MSNYNGLGFLFKRTRLNKPSLGLILEDKSFADAMKVFVESSKTIDDELIFRIAEDLYFPFLYESQQYDTYQTFKVSYKKEFGSKGYHEWLHYFKLYGRSVKKFSEDLYPQQERWFEDYKRYLKARSGDFDR